ncbi:MAG: DNA gyrase subunit B, partial [Patescibacteria group bacterium]
MAKENTDKNKDKKGDYTADDIYILEGLDPVRKRPGMYIGSTGIDGLHHLVWEIFDNSRDEAMGGHCNEIEVAILPGEKIRVVDNGRGIPVDIHKKTGVSALETVMTTLHAGGKFGGESYKISGGLHGVGASVVNALSTWLKVEVHQNGGKYVQEYKIGVPQFKVKKVGSSDFHGTVVTFEPDPKIFSETNFNYQTILNHLRQQAYLVKKLKIRVMDLRSYEGKIDDSNILYLDTLKLPVESFTFYFEGGLMSLVRYLNQREKPLHDKIFYVEKEAEGIVVESSLQYVEEIDIKEISFANNIKTPDGGMHLTGFRTALTRTINDYARKNNIIKENEDNFTGDDVREGMTAVVSVKLREPQFEGQTKAKLGNPEARTAVESVFGEALAFFLEENPSDARTIISKVLLALKARKAAKAAKESILRKGVLEGLTLPGKLADCQTRDASEAELFIVEGDSAGGSSKQGRNRRTQAILPLKGKILNVERTTIDKMLAFKEIKALIIALGAAIAEEFDLSKLRYHKIIIATDADVDGSHITTLLLTLFFRYYMPLIEQGYLYIAQPPLYKIFKG